MTAPDEQPAAPSEPTDAPAEPAFDRQALIPAVVQDATSGQVLMVDGGVVVAR